VFAEMVRILLPEIVLVAAAVLICAGGAFLDARRAWSWIAAGGTLIAAVALWMQTDAAAAQGPLAVDPLAYYARSLALALGALVVLLASRPLSTPGTAQYHGSLLLAVVGLMLVAGAGDLILLFVGLELVFIPTCTLLYLGRRDAVSQEVTAKYFFLSILASALLLYGLSSLYGLTGSTELCTISTRLAAAPAGNGALARIALVLIFSGLTFKIAAVPFHFYAPDVYEGTTNVNAALLSVVPKAAGLAGLVRLVVMVIPAGQPHVWQPCAWRIALTLAVLSMTCGNLMALRQDNLRRLLAYCSIAHVGYMLIGLAVALAAPVVGPVEWDGTGALLFCLCVYAAATIGGFAVLTYLGGEKKEILCVDELAGLGRTRPLVAAAMAVFMFSLAGISPLAGFWGKLALFAGALSVGAGPAAENGLRPWFVAAAVIAVLNVAVAAVSYVRIVGVMYFRLPLAAPKAKGGPAAWITTVVCALLVVGVGLCPGPLFRESNRASPTAVRAGQTPAITPTAQSSGWGTTMPSMQQNAADPGLPRARGGG